jgi:hypothetical protein
MPSEAQKSPSEAFCFRVVQEYPKQNKTPHGAKFAVVGAKENRRYYGGVLRV